MIVKNRLTRDKCSWDRISYLLISVLMTIQRNLVSSDFSWHCLRNKTKFEKITTHNQLTDDNIHAHIIILPQTFNLILSQRSLQRFRNNHHTELHTKVIEKLISRQTCFFSHKVCAKYRLVVIGLKSLCMTELHSQQTHSLNRTSVSCTEGNSRLRNGRPR